MLDALKGLVGGHGATRGNPTLDLIGELIPKSGGIGGLASTLQQGDLDSLVESCVGTDANQPVDGQQSGQALAGTPAGEHVEAVAQKAGVSTQDPMGQLAQLLPDVVNYLTPNGQVAVGDSGLNLTGLR